MISVSTEKHRITPNAPPVHPPPPMSFGRFCAVVQQQKQGLYRASNMRNQVGIKFVSVVYC